ncbi:MAG: ParA family protein [Ktedonobacterales bacterium]
MQIYGVTIRKGGQGKSTTVSTLARLCAIYGARVLVVDLAQPGSTTTSFRDLWPEAEHADFSHCLLAFRDLAPGQSPGPAAARATLASCNLPVRLRSMPSWSGGDISILPHDDLVSEAGAFLQSEAVLAGLLAAVSDRTDVVLIDFPVDGGPLLANAVAATARVIMPLVPEAPALEGAEATLRLLARARQSGCAIALGGILLTRCDPKSKRAAEIVRTLSRPGEVEGEPLHRKLFPFAVRQSEYYEQAFRYGVPVWDRTEDASHWSGYTLLADWVLRDAGLAQLASTPRLEARLDPATRVLYSTAIGMARPDLAYQDFMQAHATLGV